MSWKSELVTQRQLKRYLGHTVIPRERGAWLAWQTQVRTKAVNSGPQRCRGGTVQQWGQNMVLDGVGPSFRKARKELTGGLQPRLWVLILVKVLLDVHQIPSLPP